METVVEQTLRAGVPPLPDDLPEEMRADLLALETVADDELWQVARGTVSLEQQDQYHFLLEKNRLGTITKTEQDQSVLLFAISVYATMTIV